VRVENEKRRRPATAVRTARPPCRRRQSTRAAPTQPANKLAEIKWNIIVDSSSFAVQTVSRTELSSFCQSVQIADREHFMTSYMKTSVATSMVVRTVRWSRSSAQFA
jgi:hypothetical protein